MICIYPICIKASYAGCNRNPRPDGTIYNANIEVIDLKSIHLSGINLVRQILCNHGGTWHINIPHHLRKKFKYCFNKSQII